MSTVGSAVENATRQGPLFIVLNAGSGSNDTGTTRELIAGVFTKAGREHEFLMVEDAAQIAAVSARAVAQAQQRRGVVVAAGGDGTINAVAQAVINSGCPFGVLPQGTFNYFARAHGIPQDTAAAALALLSARVERVQVGQVNDCYFLVNSSVGLYPQLLEDREAYKSHFGRSRLVAILSGIVTLLRESRQLRLSIESEGETRRMRTPMLFVGNNRLQLERIGIAEAAALDRGRLVAVAVRPIGTLAMLGLLLRGALGTLGEADKVISVAFRSITVSPQGQRRIKLATDGETRWMRTPLVFRIAPEPLLLLVPAPEDAVKVE